MNQPVGMWGRAVRRLVSSQTELENDELARASQESGCATIDQCGARQLVTLQGRIGLVTLAPHSARDWLEAKLQDGTGEVTLLWMGRRVIPGIDAGRMMQVTGRLSRRGRERVLYNPRYTLLD